MSIFFWNWFLKNRWLGPIDVVTITGNSIFEGLFLHVWFIYLFFYSSIYSPEEIGYQNDPHFFHRHRLTACGLFRFLLLLHYCFIFTARLNISSSRSGAFLGPIRIGSGAASAASQMSSRRFCGCRSAVHGMVTCGAISKALSPTSWSAILT